VLLIDEVDRLDIEAEALLLEVLSEYQVSVPEFGTVTARHVPQVFLTSNNTRELSEALKRRCLFLYLGYPTAEREAEIIRLRVPGLEEHLAAEIAALVAELRRVDLKKPPSVAESLDWAMTLLALGAGELSDEIVRQTMPVLLKYQRDIDTALAELSLAR
jgi:MoxR-like ATPase